MAKPGHQEPRRAGLRPDERDPREGREEPGSAGGSPNMAGTPGGGMAAGGLGGTNYADGATEDIELDEAFGVGIHDNIDDTEEEGAPYSGRSGGAVGGTPAGKRVSGGKTHGGIAPNGDIGDDRTIGGKPR